MLVMKASFGIDQNIMDLVLKTDWGTGQTRSHAVTMVTTQDTKIQFSKSANFATPKNGLPIIKFHYRHARNVY